MDPEHSLVEQAFIKNLLYRKNRSVGKKVPFDEQFMFPGELFCPKIKPGQQGNQHKDYTYTKRYDEGMPDHRARAFGLTHEGHCGC